MYNTATNRDRSLYFTIMERSRALRGYGKGVGEPVLAWEDEFDEVSCTFQLRLGAWVCRFLRAALWTRRVYLI